VYIAIRACTIALQNTEIGQSVLSSW
jgi:hypothetical protein